MSSARVPPHSLEHEQAVLGGVLLEGLPSFVRLVEKLKPSDFYKESHRVIYQAMMALFERSQPIDLLTVQNELLLRGDLEIAGGPAELAMIFEQGAVASYMESYTQVVKDLAFKRSIIQAASQVAVQAYEDTETAQAVAESAERQLLELISGRVETRARKIERGMYESLQQIQKNYDLKSAITGLSSGISALDAQTGGFQNQNLILVGGRPGAGKTAFVLSVLTAACSQGAKALFLSMEMSEQEIIMRLLCSEARVDYMAMRSGLLNVADWMRLATAADRLGELNLWIDDTGSLTLNDVRAKARRMKQTEGLDILALDYLQLMQGVGHTRQEEIGSISRGLKSLAKDLGIPVVALSQLSRAVESRSNRDFRPQVSDLRDSGSLEQDADLILFLYRPIMYKDDIEPGKENVAEIIIGKQRNGPIGTVEAVFLAQYARFENLSYRVDPIQV